MHRYNHFYFGGFQLVPAPLSKKQRNLVVKLNRETKLHYFNNLETKNSKPFWNKCNLFFSSKHVHRDSKTILAKK